jgi:AhpD family alkylhydroperoxidase
MHPRIKLDPAAAPAVKSLQQAQAQIEASGLDYSLVELVKLRASQINGCAYCLHMHSRDARAAGEREERLHLLPAWRESNFYTERERAALAWTEAVTRLADTGAPDADFEALGAHFSEAEIVSLTLAIAMINLWNRVAVPMRTQHSETWSAAA